MNNIDATENYTLAVLDRLEAAGDRDAILAGTQRVTGRQARTRVLTYAAALREAQLGPGDGVALFVANSPEAVLLILAAHFVGCRLVFVPPEPGDSELEALVEQAEVKALIFDTARERRARHLTARVPVASLFSIGPSSLAADLLTAAANSAPLAPRHAVDGHHVVTLFYTGGTTGRPKLVTHGSSYYDALVHSRMAGAPVADPRMLICTLVTHHQRAISRHLQPGGR
jgi:fatty-acyl-CoA synthase